MSYIKSVLFNLHDNHYPMCPFNITMPLKIGTYQVDQTREGRGANCNHRMLTHTAREVVKGNMLRYIQNSDLLRMFLRACLSHRQSFPQPPLPRPTVNVRMSSSHSLFRSVERVWWGRPARAPTSKEKPYLLAPPPPLRPAQYCYALSALRMEVLKYSKKQFKMKCSCL